MKMILNPIALMAVLKIEWIVADVFYPDVAFGGTRPGEDVKHT